MALQSSGQITLNDIHVEAGGTSGSLAATSDADIRALLSPTPSATAEMQLSDWYGASAVNSVSFNVTVGGYNNTYAQAGFITYNSPSNNYGSPTSSVSITSNVRCTGVTKGLYPYAGSPSTYIYFATGTGLVNPCTDSAYANMYYTVSGGGYTTGNIPIGSAVRAARVSAYSSGKVNFQSSTYLNSTYNQNYGYNNYLHDSTLDYLWPSGQPSHTVNNTSWVVTIYW